MFGAGPTGAVLVDRTIGHVDPQIVALFGDLLVTFDRSTGLAVRPLSEPSRQPRTLFDPVSIQSISPGGRYAVAVFQSRR